MSDRKPLAFSELVGEARQRLKMFPDDELARGFLELFGEEPACGFPKPELRNGGVGIPAEWVTVVEPLEAEMMARMLLVGAEEGKKQS